MCLRFLFLAVATAALVLPGVATAQFQQAPPPYLRYEPPPPPPPPGYYDNRRRDYDDRRYDDRRYRERDVYRQPRGVFCAQEGGFCNFQGPAVVRYGGAGRFTTRRAFNGIPCTNSAFGDPAPGVNKACFID
jgi:hypothetical protein